MVLETQDPEEKGTNEAIPSTSVEIGAESKTVFIENLKEVDVGTLYANAARENPPSPKEETAVRWKIDWRVMPILFFNVVLASVDKTSTSTGAL